MLYAWNDPQKTNSYRSPTVYLPPKYSFTALLPARHEEKVIADTIKAISQINYPQELTEILVICRCDDPGTIEMAQKAIFELKKNNIRLVIFDDLPINKPHGLNLGLSQANKDVVVIFDAEDEPHREIYNVVNTIIQAEGVDVVQSGVQLMNYNSSWFATLNVLEYFFWFKSTLQFFARAGLIPLGGNTVFFKKEWLKKINGWDENCLTEDADIGIRLSSIGAKIRIIYDEEFATKEETPSTVSQFIKQRTRWNQGFLQIFLKGDWLKLPKLSQRLLAVYILVWPAPQTLLLLNIPISLFVILFVKMPIAIAMLSMVPFYILIIQIVIYNIGLYEFTKSYHFPFSFWMPLKIFYSFFLYQFILGASAIRAVWRMIIGNFGWEKTTHINAHRQPNLETANINIKR